MANSSIRIKLPELNHLGHTEDIDSFTSWHFRLEQHLYAVPQWKDFLSAKWKTPDVDKFMGLTSDADTVKNALTKEEKYVNLVQMLEFIAGYANPVAMREEILFSST